jgi:hypothetical protein
MKSPDDPRKMLELHQRRHHKDKGENTVENLVTLCNVHHDDRHRKDARVAVSSTVTQHPHEK